MIGFGRSAFAAGLSTAGGVVASSYVWHGLTVSSGTPVYSSQVFFLAASFPCFACMCFVWRGILTRLKNILIKLIFLKKIE